MLTSALFSVFPLQRKVQLLSPDKQTFEVEWDVAMRSTVVKQMLEGASLLPPVCLQATAGLTASRSVALLAVSCLLMSASILPCTLAEDAMCRLLSMA